MDDQHLKDLSSHDGSDAVRCLICLNTFSGQPVANPQHCDHFYCLTCITEWAKTSASCPVDRQKFTVLYQRNCVGRGFQKILPVKPHDGQELEEEGQHEDLSVCEECGRSDRRHLMLLCSACDSRFHIACLRPPLAAVPFEDWFCKECVTGDSHTNDFSRDESEIDNAEMIDVLSDVVPTSSRLRPSMTAQRLVSVQTRSSERVRLQSSRTHTTLSRTVQHVPRYLLKAGRCGSDEATTSNLILNTKQTRRTLTRKQEEGKEI